MTCLVYSLSITFKGQLPCEPRIWPPGNTHFLNNLQRSSQEVVFLHAAQAGHAQFWWTGHVIYVLDSYEPL